MVEKTSIRNNKPRSFHTYPEVFMPLMTFFLKLENFVILLNMPFTWGLKLCYKYYLFLRILCNIAKYHRLQLYNNHLHSSEDNSGVLNLSCSYNQLTTLSQHQPLYWFSVHQIWMLLKTVHVNKHLYSKLDLCLKKKRKKGLSIPDRATTPNVKIM